MTEDLKQPTVDEQFTSFLDSATDSVKILDDFTFPQSAILKALAPKEYEALREEWLRQHARTPLRLV